MNIFLYPQRRKTNIGILVPAFSQYFGYTIQYLCIVGENIISLGIQQQNSKFKLTGSDAHLFGIEGR